MTAGDGGASRVPHAGSPSSSRASRPRDFTRCSSSWARPRDSNGPRRRATRQGRAARVDLAPPGRSPRGATPKRASGPAPGLRLENRSSPAERRWLPVTNGSPPPPALPSEADKSVALISGGKHNMSSETTFTKSYVEGQPKSPYQTSWWGPMAANSAVVGQQVAKKEPFERLAREARERYLLAKEDWATTTDDLIVQPSKGSGSRGSEAWLDPQSEENVHEVLYGVASRRAERRRIDRSRGVATGASSLSEHVTRPSENVLETTAARVETSMMTMRAGRPVSFCKATCASAQPAEPCTPPRHPCRRPPAASDLCVVVWALLTDGGQHVARLRLPGQ